MAFVDPPPWAHQREERESCCTNWYVWLSTYSSSACGTHQVDAFPGGPYLPMCPGHGKVTHVQRDSAELARIRIRESQRRLRIDPRAALEKVPALEVLNPALLEAHRAEKVAQARKEQQSLRLAALGKHRLTRSAAALLQKEFEEESGGGRQTDRWEERALAHMFGKRGDEEDGALSEVISAFDEADAEPSPDGSDDSDFDEGKASSQAGDCDEDDTDDHEEEGGDKDDDAVEDGVDKDDTEEGEDEEDGGGDDKDKVADKDEETEDVDKSEDEG
ncbi:unnamed protein product, partial [Phytophthora fragariaefolia]